MPIKYLSLFSGIGGFEIAIHNIFPNAICIGYSEVDKHALKVYQHHFPNHQNLGDITKITKSQIKKVIEKYGDCDLVVGGFPCQNLTSLARMNHDNAGLHGVKSGLFFELVRILSYIPNVHVIIENNASMKNEYKTIITTTLNDVLKYPINMTHINASEFGVQTRRRLYWTTFSVNSPICKIQDWDSILNPVEECYSLQSNPFFIKNSMNKIVTGLTKQKEALFAIRNPNGLYTFSKKQINGITRWNKSYHSVTYDKCTPIIRHRTCSHNVLIDTRVGDKDEVMIRTFDVSEIERLFFFPNNWVKPLLSPRQSFLVLGNTVVVKVIEHILTSLLKHPDFTKNYSKKLSD